MRSGDRRWESDMRVRTEFTQVGTRHSLTSRVRTGIKRNQSETRGCCSDVSRSGPGSEELNLAWASDRVAAGKTIGLWLVWNELAAVICEVDGLG